MRFLKYTVYVFTIATLTIGCRSTDEQPCTDVNQDKIFQMYEVTYDGQDNTTRAVAQMRFGGTGGTLLTMAGNCSLNHNLYTLNHQSVGLFLGNGYVGSGSGFDANHSFIFNDDLNRKYTNGGNLNSISLVGPPATMSISSTNIQIPFSDDGQSISADEDLRVIISYEADNGSYNMSFFYIDGPTTSPITLNLASHGGMTTGTGHYYVSRVSYVPLQEVPSEAGGEIYFNYKTDRVSLVLNN